MTVINDSANGAGRVRADQRRQLRDVSSVRRAPALMRGATEHGRAESHLLCLEVADLDADGRSRRYTCPMQVEVHLYAELARLAPDNRGVLTLDVPDGAHVSDLLERLALDTLCRIIVGLNGEAVSLDQELVDGARIDLLTPMAGGSPA